LSARAAEAGVDVSRIHFSPRTTHSEFCGRLKLADVFLDTYPYNCGSTSNDVINAGIPLNILINSEDLTDNNFCPTASFVTSSILKAALWISSI
jgi:hypothetical protein